MYISSSCLFYFILFSFKFVILIARFVGIINIYLKRILNAAKSLSLFHTSPTTSPQSARKVHFHIFALNVSWRICGSLAESARAGGSLLLFLQQMLALATK